MPKNASPEHLRPSATRLVTCPAMGVHIDEGLRRSDMGRDSERVSSQKTRLQPSRAHLRVSRSHMQHCCDSHDLAQFYLDRCSRRPTVWSPAPDTLVLADAIPMQKDYTCETKQVSERRLLGSHA